MSKVSSIVSGGGFFTEFITAFIKKAKKFGVTDEALYNAAKTDSEFIEKFAEKCAEMIAGIPKRVLKHLKLAEENIKISSPAFSKSKFFDSKDGVKIWLGDNFKRLILPEISEMVPAFEGNFSSFNLTKYMYDSEIRQEIGAGTMTPDEWLAKTHFLILKQPKGEQGSLLSNGYANIDYVRLKNGNILAVHAHWSSGLRGWDLRAFGLGSYGWDAGRSVFSCS